MEDNIPNSKERKEKSKVVGENMYGKNWNTIQQSLEKLDPVFAEFVSEIPYGSVFTRENLDMKSRQIASISVLTLLNLKTQLKSHIIAGLRVGLTEIEIRELMLHLAQFIGYPLCLDSLKVLDEVIKHNKQ